MTAAMHWTVIAVDGAGQGHGYCGHRHATADEATRCPWDPPRPFVCDLLVRQVRSEAVPGRRDPVMQLGLFPAPTRPLRQR